LIQISWHNIYIGERNKKKEEDEDSKYYQIVPVKISFF
jgi:hypothetical protein